LQECPDSSERKTFPVEELHRADGFVIVYSITDRSSFTFALEALSDIYNTYNNSQQANSTSSTASASTSQGLPTPPKPICPVTLIANKNDLEHLREVDKVEGISASMEYGCQFYELSVAENSPLVYQSFQSIVTTLIGQTQLHHNLPKRKFSVSKMLGTLRLGRTSPSASLPIATAPASIVDTNVFTNSTTSSSTPSSSSAVNSPAKSRESSPFSPRGGKGGNHQRQGSNSSSDTSSNSSGSSNNLTSSICQLKSKLVELHSMKRRSPPICSL
jgi:hypothetical protein